MAAVIAPQHRPSARPDLRPTQPSRPALRVIEGGRRPGDPWVPAPAAHPRRSAPAAGRTRRPIPARVYRQRRIAAVVVVLALTSVLALAVVGALSVASSAFAGPSAASAAPAAVAPAAADAPVWVVQPGDTLWTIAAELQPEGDVRPLVDALADRAGGAGLQAGQRIPLDGLLP